MTADLVQATQLLRNYLHAQGKRFTPEREAILAAALQFPSHFTPEQLQEALSAQGRHMSIVTVYRNLPVLCEARILRRTCLSSAESLYERAWSTEHHDHLICSVCGRVVEFQYEAIEVLQETVASRFGFSLTSHQLELMGTCAECCCNHETPTGESC